MNETGKETLKAAGSAVVGGTVGAGVSSAIGGMGLVALGGGIGITMAPVVCIGAGVGLAGYGCFWLGKQVGGSTTKQASVPPKNGDTRQNSPNSGPRGD
jgi:hypothetical protein